MTKTTYPEEGQVMKKLFIITVMMTLAMVLVLTVSSVFGQLVITDPITRRKTPARDYTYKENYFKQNDVEFLFMKGAIKAMKASGVSLNRKFQLSTPNDRQKYIDFLSETNGSKTIGYVFGPNESGKLVISQYLKDGRIRHVLFDKGKAVRLYLQGPEQ
jgi:hypothetical protein